MILIMLIKIAKYIIGFNAFNFHTTMKLMVFISIVLAYTLLSVYIHQLSFPDEEDTATFYQIFLMTIHFL